MLPLKACIEPMNLTLIYTNNTVWQRSDMFNNTASFGWSHSYNYKNGNGKINLEFDEFINWK